jgi:hypothetical protein
MSTFCSSRWVAKLCRKVCGEKRLDIQRLRRGGDGAPKLAGGHRVDWVLARKQPDLQNLMLSIAATLGHGLPALRKESAMSGSIADIVVDLVRTSRRQACLRASSGHCENKRPSVGIFLKEHHPSLIVFDNVDPVFFYGFACSLYPSG